MKRLILALSMCLFAFAAYSQTPIRYQYNSIFDGMYCDDLQTTAVISPFNEDFYHFDQHSGIRLYEITSDVFQMGIPSGKLMYQFSARDPEGFNFFVVMSEEGCSMFCEDEDIRTMKTINYDIFFLNKDCTTISNEVFPNQIIIKTH